MGKDKDELPLEKFIEIPEDIVRGQISEVFNEETKEAYDIQYIKPVDGGWVVKLLRRPAPAFSYQKGKKKHEVVD